LRQLLLFGSLRRRSVRIGGGCTSQLMSLDSHAQTNGREVGCKPRNIFSLRVRVFLRDWF